MKGSITLDYTYDATLGQSSARTCWYLTLLHNKILMGTNATNTFGESPPPKSPLYVTINKLYKLWWEKVIGQPPFKLGHVFPVKHALQGHPKSPCIWTRKIHGILSKQGFISKTLEPWLYKGQIDGSHPYLLRHVDKFKIPLSSHVLAQSFLDKIQDNLAQPLKHLGTINMYKSLDVLQTSCYNKFSCQMYITKILQGHGWETPTSASTVKTPMRNDKKYFQTLETLLDLQTPTIASLYSKPCVFHTAKP